MTVIVLPIGIVAASIVFNDNSQCLLFSLLLWFWVSSQSHCILRELQHYWAGLGRVNIFACSLGSHFQDLGHSLRDLPAGK